VIPRRISRGALCAALALPLLLLASLARPASAERNQESPTKIETQYQNERDPVRKAKLLGKLGPLEVMQARTYLPADEDKAVATVAHYRDEVRDTAAALAAANLNVEKHPAGFKELQIGLRETITRLNDMLFVLPVDDRPPLEAVRTDLVAVQESLFSQLFPTAAEKSDNKKSK
jgi:hypothetical protein